jgi:hypothetical protein
MKRTGKWVPSLLQRHAKPRIATPPIAVFSILIFFNAAWAVFLIQS